jgi:Xaa-Pro aminopeptidase
VHDVGKLNSPRPFEPGVVFNVEPIYQSTEKKVHLRLEDTVLVTEKGAENLTASAPADLESIYSLIRQK